MDFGFDIASLLSIGVTVFLTVVVYRSDIKKKLNEVINLQHMIANAQRGVLSEKQAQSLADIYLDLIRESLNQAVTRFFFSEEARAYKEKGDYYAFENQINAIEAKIRRGNRIMLNSFIINSGISFDEFINTIPTKSAEKAKSAIKEIVKDMFEDNSDIKSSSFEIYHSKIIYEINTVNSEARELMKQELAKVYANYKQTSRAL